MRWPILLMVTGLIFSIPASSHGQIIEYVASTAWSGTNGVQVVDNYAFCSDINGLHIFDITDPENPIPISQYYLSGGGHAIAVDGNYAYLCDGDEGVYGFDISDPYHPVLLGNYVTPGPAVDISIASIAGNKYAFIADEWSLEIVDINDPLNPEWVAGMHDCHEVLKVTVEGNYAYLIVENIFGIERNFEIVDVSNPTAPNVIGGFSATFSFMSDLDVEGHYAYITNHAYRPPYYDFRGLFIFDVSNPSDPALCDFYFMFYSPGSVDVVRKYAYLTNSSGLHVVNVSDPYQPFEVGFCQTPGGVVNVAVTDNLALLPAQELGFSVVSLPDPTSPVLLSTVAKGLTRGIYAFQDWACSAGSGPEFRTMDISSPSNPILHGELNFEADSWKVWMSYEHAYLAGGASGFSIINMENPRDPVVEGVYDNPLGGVRCIYVSDSMAFLGVDHVGLDIVNIANDANPILVGSVPLESGKDRDAKGIWKSGAYIFISIDYSGIYAIDISDPYNPLEVGYFQTRYPNGLCVISHYIYLAGGANGFMIIDASDLSDMHIIGQSEEGFGAWDVTVYDHFAFLAVYQSGLKVFDISDPANPILLQTFNTAGKAFDVHYSDGFIYLADEYSIAVFRLLQTDISEDQNGEIPILELVQNYPNPFNTSTHIQFNLPSNSMTDISIYDILGRKVETLLSEDIPAGTHSLVWNAQGLASGIYFYKLTTGRYSQTRSCSLLK